MEEKVILVDEHDNILGEEEKLKAHQAGKLHRAISVFVFNSRGDFLIQQRADCKYHSAGLWSNTCCSHPRAGEGIMAAAERRLKEEMGMSSVNLKNLFSFIYKTELDNGLIEHELDHVLVANSLDLPASNPKEVKNYKYVSYDFLKKDLKDHPTIYAEWFKILIDEYGDRIYRSFINNGV